MKPDELILIQNQIYTQILLDEFRNQRKAGAVAPADFLIDKFTIDKMTADKLKEYLSNNG